MLIGHIEGTMGREYEPIPAMEADPSFTEIIGKSAVLRAILDQIEKVGPTDVTVLLLGESGPGKEVMASTIHECSQRRSHRLVRVNCASVLHFRRPI
jgi:formate hydrogenlyase transcriptional activator